MKTAAKVFLILGTFLYLLFLILLIVESHLEKISEEILGIGLTFLILGNLLNLGSIRILYTATHKNEIIAYAIITLTITFIGIWINLEPILKLNFLPFYAIIRMFWEGLEESIQKLNTATHAVAIFTLILTNHIAGIFMLCLSEKDFADPNKASTQNDDEECEDDDDDYYEDNGDDYYEDDEYEYYEEFDKDYYEEK